MFTSDPFQSEPGYCLISIMEFSCLDTFQNKVLCNTLSLISIISIKKKQATEVNTLFELWNCSLTSLFMSCQFIHSDWWRWWWRDCHPFSHVFVYLGHHSAAFPRLPYLTERWEITPAVLAKQETKLSNSFFKSLGMRPSCFTFPILLQDTLMYFSFRL